MEFGCASYRTRTPAGVPAQHSGTSDSRPAAGELPDDVRMIAERHDGDSSGVAGSIRKMLCFQ